MDYKPGKFITLEGIEGVGKSSNMQYIANFLQKAGRQVLLTREPGGTPLAEDLRKILLTEYPQKTLPDTELLLLYAGRLQHVTQVIAPALAQGKWVLSDRFTDATYAYQGQGPGIAVERIDKLHEWVLGDFTPDCTIILDAPVSVAFERIHTERTLDRFEKEKAEFFEKIRQAYLTRAQQAPKRCHVVDAALAFPLVQRELERIITTLLDA